MFDESDILLVEAFGASRNLFALINDIHKQITDTGMHEAEYTTQQLKDDYGINFNGSINVRVVDGDDCLCQRVASGCIVEIGRGVIDNKAAYQKIAHELTHFTTDKQGQIHDNNANWEAGLKGGFGSPEQIASYIVELYSEHELRAKVNEMYYQCIGNPRFVCDKIKEFAEFGNGNVKLYYNSKNPKDNNSLINQLFNELENTVHLQSMLMYYNNVYGTPDGNSKSAVPVLVRWSSQRNFPFKFRSRSLKDQKEELLNQMKGIYAEYSESLVNVMKNLIKEFVKAFFNKGQNAKQGSQQETQEGPQQQQQQTQQTNNRFEEYSENSMSESMAIKCQKIIEEEIKKATLNSQHKDILHETWTQKNTTLKNHLKNIHNMDDDVLFAVANVYPGLYFNFLMGVNPELAEEYEDDLYDCIDGITDGSMTYFIKKYNLPIDKRFGYYVKRHINSFPSEYHSQAKVYYRYSEIPDNITLNYEKPFLNRVLVHLTQNDNDAESILTNGFKYGAKLNRLAWTYGFKDNGDYAFAYDFHDFLENLEFYPTYGVEGVVFIASGVMITHHGDVHKYAPKSTNECIFDKDSVKDFICRFVCRCGYCEIYNAENKLIFSAKNWDFKKMFTWISNNLIRY